MKRSKSQYPEAASKKNGLFTYVQSAKPGFFQYDPLLFACNHLQCLNTLLLCKLDISISDLTRDIQGGMRTKLLAYRAEAPFLPQHVLKLFQQQTYRRKKKRLEYGPFTAPKPDKMALMVTPMTPTRDIPHSMDQSPIHTRTM
jgi:hypothetical protein